MMMCYNFFVGMCSRCSELIHSYIIYYIFLAFSIASSMLFIIYKETYFIICNDINKIYLFTWYVDINSVLSVFSCITMILEILYSLIMHTININHINHNNHNNYTNHIIHQIT